jgi:hypothetical protein
LRRVEVLLDLRLGCFHLESEKRGDELLLWGILHTTLIVKQDEKAGINKLRKMVDYFFESNS